MGNRKSTLNEAPETSRGRAISQPIPRSSLSSNATQGTSGSPSRGFSPAEFDVEENPLLIHNHETGQPVVFSSRQHPAFKSRSSDAVIITSDKAVGSSHGELKRSNLRGSIRKVWSALFESPEKSKKRPQCFQTLSLGDIDTLNKVPRTYTEMDLADCWHYAFRELLNGNYMTKLSRSRVRNILQEMAQEFPYANVVGIEETRVRVYDCSIPPNCSFRAVPNFQVPFPFQLSSFDFICVRILTPHIPQSYFTPLYRHLYELLRPGGRIEIIETNMLHTEPSRPYTLQMNDWITEYFQLLSRNIAVFENMEVMLQESGFHQISTAPGGPASRMQRRVIIERLIMPTGSWAGRIGEVMLYLWLKEGERLAAEIGIADEEFKQWKEGWIEEVENEGRGKWQLMVVRAKKDRM